MRLSALCLSVLILTPAGLAAQSEAALRAAFEGRLVAPRLDMPATKGGVNVYPYRPTPLDQGDLAREVASHGVGVPSGRATAVTRIKVKGKHIEFQLGRGGERQEPSRSSSYVGKSREEERLEDEIKNTTDRDQKERLEDQLRDLQDRRYREEQRLRALDRAERDMKLSQHTPEEWALMAGARFNVRFDSKVPAEALTPEGLKAMMARWVDFEPQTQTQAARGAPASAPPGGVRKGMTETEVERDYGPPLNCEESRASGLLTRICNWSLSEGHLQAHFVEGVLVKYTLSSAPRPEPAQVSTSPDDSRLTREIVAQLVQKTPAFAAGNRSSPEVGRLVPIVPGSGAYYTEVGWEEAGAKRAAIVTVGPVSLNPEAPFLARVGGFGLLHVIEDFTLADVIKALETALDLNRQRQTMGSMLSFATSNQIMKVDTGRYATELSELEGKYMPDAPATDSWGNPWVYVPNDDGYSLVSHGSDGVPGPVSPDEWRGEPFECDLVLVNGSFVDAPESPTRPSESNRKVGEAFQPWMQAPPRKVDRQRQAIETMLALFTANETMRAATGAYATDLADLYAAGYLRKRVVLDAWGTPFVYRREGEGYVLASYGCDGAPGPPPPADWKKAPCEPDIIIRNSGWVQAPRDP